nr:poly-Ig receptor - dog (fragments) [Canis lupus familiaris]
NVDRVSIGSYEFGAIDNPETALGGKDERSSKEEADL